MATEKKCPALGVGSVDFNAVHEAAAKGHDLEKAIEKATTRVEAPKADPDSPKAAATKAAD